MKKSTATVTAAAALLAAATPASAATTVPYGGFTAKQRPVVLKVATSGRQIVLARTALDITCSDGSADFAPDAWEKVPVSRTGSFDGTFKDEPGTTFDNKQMISSGFIRGRLDAKRRRITGTWKLESRVTQADGSVVTCTTGTVRFSGGAKNERRPGGLFGAFSAAQHPLVLELTSNGRSVRMARGAFELSCSKGGYRYVTDGWNRLAISRRGTFRASVTDSDAKFSDGGAYKVTASITGKVDRTGRRLNGTWRVHWEIPEADGVTDVCDSGAVRFSVRR